MINSKTPSPHPVRLPLRTPHHREDRRMVSIAELRREAPWLTAYLRGGEHDADRVDFAALEERHRSLQGRALQRMQAAGLDVAVRVQDGSGSVQTAQDGHLAVSAGQIVIELDQPAKR